MSINNLLKSSQNYSMKSESLWNCQRDQIYNADDNASDGKSFNYKTKIVRKNTKKTRTTGTTTTKSRWNLTTTATTTSSTSFKC